MLTTVPGTWGGHEDLVDRRDSQLFCCSVVEMSRLLGAVNGVLVLGLTGSAFWAWPLLPGEIPTHFGVDGLPDAWGAKTLGSWFGIPGIALLLSAGIAWFRRMIPRRPRWVKLPDKTKLTDLPEVARAPVVEMFSGFLALI